MSDMPVTMIFLVRYLRNKYFYTIIMYFLLTLRHLIANKGITLKAEPNSADRCRNAWSLLNQLYRCHCPLESIGRSTKIFFVVQACRV